MIRRYIVPAIVGLVTVTTCGGAAFAQDSLDPLTMPEAPTPNPEQVVPTPRENEYLPMRTDGQPYQLNIDLTNNLTDWLNHFYFNPKWRGYSWSPYPLYFIVERQSRMMFLWPDYDEQNVYALGNRWCKFLEKYSGYGPGPPGGFVVK